MTHKKLSLRLRIFFSMLSIVVLASVLMATTAIYQYNEEAEEYHNDRLLRKENTIKAQIHYQLKSAKTQSVSPKNIALFFKEKGFIYELSDVHNLQVHIYSLTGEFLSSSDGTTKNLSRKTVLSLKNSPEKREVTRVSDGNNTIQSSYSYLVDYQSKPLAIIALPYIKKNEIISAELQGFLNRLGGVYALVLLIAIILSFILSKYITKSLLLISNKINQTRFDKRNTKIDPEFVSEEIRPLVSSYNSMIDELQESAVKLAANEREQAWREMAKQVAHEIKNPLTPMRLSVQRFQQKFDVNDPEMHERLAAYTKLLLQQIDTMTRVSNAFANFAQMPKQKNESLNVIEVVRLAVDLFRDKSVIFTANKEAILGVYDGTQLTRVLTNLVQNAIQACAEKDNPKIIVAVSDTDNNINITVSDNGVGILPENKLHIFEPKFTTKTSGMGLGLAMVKNIIETYNGSITFTSEKNKGTIFTIVLPKNNLH